MKIILLAAGVGKRLAPYTEARPKCLMEVGGVTLLERHLVHFERLRADSVTVVVGHVFEAIEREIARVAPHVAVRIVKNDDYKRGSILSLKKGLDGIEDDVIFMDADVVYHPDVLGRLFNSAHPSAVLIDASASETGEEMMIGVRGGRAAMIARKVSHAGPFEVMGESVGFFRVGAAHLPQLKAMIDATIDAEGDNVEYENAVNRFFDVVEVGFERVDDLDWTEIDFEQDLARARDEIAPKLPPLERKSAR